ncbi:hypothetical protein [Actinophytocola sp. KF-1]
MTQKRTFSQPGTARALVLLASALALAGAVLVFLLAIVFGSSLRSSGLAGGVLAGTAIFAGTVLVSALVANLLAIRSGSVRGIVGVGCGTLLAGTLVGLGACLFVISKAA